MFGYLCLRVPVLGLERIFLLACGKMFLDGMMWVDPRVLVSWASCSVDRLGGVSGVVTCGVRVQLGLRWHDDCGDLCLLVLVLVFCLGRTG